MNRFLVRTIIIAGTALAAGGTQVQAAGSPIETANCLKRIVTKGPPHRISSVAGLNAVRTWTRRARQHGEAYAMWHNADSANLECAKLSGSDFYQCQAAGKPCRASRQVRVKSRQSAN